jgi:hypothetical protein
MSVSVTPIGYSNTPDDRIAITIQMFRDIGWSDERVHDRINQWLQAMTLTGHWWEQSEQWQARLHAAMRIVWEQEFNGCTDF